MTWRKNRKSFPYWFYNLRFKGFRIMDWPQVSSIKNTSDFDFLLSSPLTWIGNGLSLFSLNFFLTEIKLSYSWRATFRGFVPLFSIFDFLFSTVGQCYDCHRCSPQICQQYNNVLQHIKIVSNSITWNIIFWKKNRLTYLTCVCLF